MKDIIQGHPRWLLFLSLALLSAIMFYFIWLAPPMTDNFIFSHDIKPGYAEFYTGSQIAIGPMTLASAWRQAIDMYFTWCGRFTGNLIVYLLFMLPHWLYALLAAGLYGLYLLALLMCIFGREWKQRISPGWLFGMAALLWASIPSYGEAFFWLSVGGQIALLGQALILLPFRFALDASIHSKNALTAACCATGLCAAGFAVSMLDYPTSAALPPTAVICVVFLWLRDRAFPWLLAFCALGLCLGGLATLTAPGNFSRLTLSTDPDVVVYLSSSWAAKLTGWLMHLPGAAMQQFPALLFLVCSCLRLARTAPAPWFRHIPISAWLFFIPACLTHGAYLFTAWPPSRAFATSSVQLLICACIIFVSAPTPGIGRMFKFLRSLLCLYCVCSLAYEACQFQILSREYEEREALIAKAAESATLPPISVLPDRHQPLGGPLGDISADPGYWINRAVASHYGLKTVILSAPELGDGEFIYQRSAEQPASLAIKAHNGRLQLSAPQQNDIHIYYHGTPGLLPRLPFGLDQSLFARLANAKEGDWALKLIPLLMAREDIKAGDWRSDQLKLKSTQKLWLVEPGKPWWSQDIIPLSNSRVAPGTLP